jgi:TRAP-type C4-dicarboxylate transport system permease small subunit
MRVLERFVSRVCRIFLYLATVELICVTFLITVSVIMRYVARAPFAFTEELVGLLISSMLFLSLPFALLEGKHIRMDLVTARLQGLWLHIAGFFAFGALAAFLVLFSLRAYESFQFAFRLGIKSEVSGMHLSPWMGLVPLSVLFMLLVALVVAGRDYLVHASRREEKEKR